MSARLALGVLLALLSTSCRSLGRDRNPWTAENTVGKVGSVEFTLTEHAYDDDFHVPPGRPHTVDFGSTLALHFATDTATGASPVDPDWRVINTWLERLDELSRERRRLDETIVDLADRNALAQFQAQDNAFTKAVNELAAEAEELLASILTPEEVDAVVFGEFDGIEDTLLQNVARWMRQHHRELVLRGNERKSDAPRDQITVLAFKRPRQGEQERLHVENYDTIAAASDHVPDRFSLDLSERELAKLKMEIQQSEQAAQFLRNIDGRLDDLGELREELVAEVRKTLVKIQELSADDIEDLDAGLDAAKSFLEGLRGGTLDETRLDAMLADLEVLRGANELRGRWVALADGLRGILEPGGAADLTAFLSGATGVLTTLDRLKEDGGRLAQDALRMVEAAARLARNAAELLSDATLTDWKNALPDSLERALDGYLAELTALVDDLLLIVRAMEAGRGADQLFADYSPDSISSEGLDSIARDIGNLLDGRVALGGVVEEGDTIVLRVELRDAGGETKESADYLLKVGREGWFRNVTGNAILARASRGTDSAKDWKPNVAALVSWQYHERYPNGWGRAMNWLEPSLGVHAASLDMGDESVEFGLGGNLTILGGLLSFGVGENLSVSEGDGTYMFVATDLLRLLGNLQPGDRSPTER